MPPSWIGIILVGIAVIFVGVTLRDFLKEQGQLTIARRTWLRIAFVFIVVGLGVFLINLFW